MAKKKGVLQKVSLVSALLSFVLALISGVMLYIRLQSGGIDNPITASFLASTFFFLCVGVVLAVMGSADLPNLKIDNSHLK